MSKLHGGGVEGRHDVPPRRRLHLGDEDLGAADIVDVDQRDAAGGRLDELQLVDHVVVACDRRSITSDVSILTTM
jgi:hypothetical protein